MEDNIHSKDSKLPHQLSTPICQPNTLPDSTPKSKFKLTIVTDKAESQINTEEVETVRRIKSEGGQAAGVLPAILKGLSSSFLHQSDHLLAITHSALGLRRSY